MTRRTINLKIEAKIKKINQLRQEIKLLQMQSFLLSDKKQQYYEEEIEVVISRRPKRTEKQIRGIVTWKENFVDRTTKEKVSIQRYMVVKINGEWVI
jgi:hypothetical protein